VGWRVSRIRYGLISSTNFRRLKRENHLSNNGPAKRFLFAAYCCNYDLRLGDYPSGDIDRSRTTLCRQGLAAITITTKALNLTAYTLVPGLRPGTDCNCGSAAPSPNQSQVQPCHVQDTNSARTTTLTS